MSSLILRDAGAADFTRIVELNAAAVTQTSPMDVQRLGELHALSAHHRVAEREGEVVAFLLAMEDTATYENANFQWFSAHLPRFVYIDRIVVDDGAAGHGIGANLYADVFAHARQRDIGHVVCEYNLDPPNPASAAFHQRLGFREIGRQPLPGGKFVSMQQFNLFKDTAQ